jgi:dynein assembly factor with WDR repeat domains 1
MKLKRFLLRYYPPGIILEYLRSNQETETKSIDLLNLTPQTNIEVLANQILFEEPAISQTRKPQLKKLIQKLIEKLQTNQQ